MPAKNTVRFYTSDSYYHVYNRGVEKRIIFQGASDYKIFLYYLFIYLAPPEIVKKTYPRLRIPLKNGNFHSRLTLHSFALMPNHFHLLLHQKDERNVTDFMKRITNAYTRYFNERYERVGSLFQGVYKAAHITSDEYLLYLSRYIHLNPLLICGNSGLENYIWSSYRVYLGLQKTTYVNSEYILQFFSNSNSRLSYKDFVEGEDDFLIPEEIMIEK